MLPDLSYRAVGLSELMDDPQCDQETLERTYSQFGMINAAVSRWRSVYRREVLPRARRATRRVPLRVLDIGTGGADLPRRMLEWAAHDKAPIDVVAIDSDPRAIDWASRQGVPPRLVLETATSSTLVDRRERFDVVLSNHVLHHLSAIDMGRLLADSERLVLPGGLALHSDLARSATAYALFGAATWPLQWGVLRGSFIRADGLTSIRRAFTVRELRGIVPQGWEVRRRFPAHLELRWEH